jgi:cullin 1
VCYDVYEEYFKTPFITATEIYYRQESEAFLAANSVSEYVKKAKERLKEEENRVEHYSNIQTWTVLISTCEAVLIRDHSALMCERFQTLLDLDMDEDLQQMCALLSRIPEGLELLQKIFEEHVKKSPSLRRPAVGNPQKKFGDGGKKLRGRRRLCGESGQGMRGILQLQRCY